MRKTLSAECDKLVSSLCLKIKHSPRFQWWGQMKAPGETEARGHLALQALTQTAAGLQGAFQPTGPWRDTYTLGEGTQRQLLRARTPADINNANWNTLERQGWCDNLPHAP